MNKKLVYVTPLLRKIDMRADSNFLASGFGEDANPETGQWSSGYFDGDF